MAARSQSVSNIRLQDKRRLRELAGVGKAVEHGLLDLGVKDVAGLASRSGDRLYTELCTLSNSRQDPCVLDTLRCAVAQARDPNLPVEQRNWWWWSRERKAGRLPGVPAV